MAVKRRITTGVAAVAVAAGGLLATGVSPAAAAAPNCTEWEDINTYGTTCSGFPSGREVRAMAKCRDGYTAKGAWRSASSGGWSYAFCAGHGGLNYVWGDWRG